MPRRTLTRRNYEALAAILRDCQTEGGINSPLFQASRIMADRLADYLQRDNPAFDRQRFMRACGFRED